MRFLPDPRRRTVMAEPAPPKKKPLKTEDDRLETALEDSFPASDPPAMTAPSRHIGKPAKPKKNEEKPSA